MSAHPPSDNAPDAQGFRQLWPVLFMQRILPGADQANPVLEQMIARVEAPGADH